jgi:hypothetical protein
VMSLNKIPDLGKSGISRIKTAAKSSVMYQ